MSKFNIAKNLPAVSVVMPVYNTASYVAQAIQSILDQTLDDFEFIIVDDGSTDGSVEILREYAARDSRIRLQLNDHGGTSVAANTATDMVRSELMARIDSDDWSLAYRLEHQFEIMSKRPEAAALGGVFMQVESADMDEAIQRYVNSSLGEYEIRSGDCRCKFCADDLDPYVCQGTMMVRTEAMRKTGGYRNCFIGAEEADLFRRLREHGEFINSSSVVLLYRQHGAQTNSSDDKKWQKMVSCLSAIECAWLRQNGHGDPSDNRETPVDYDFLLSALALRPNIRRAHLVHMLVFLRFDYMFEQIGERRIHDMCADQVPTWGQLFCHWSTSVLVFRRWFVQDIGKIAALSLRHRWPERFLVCLKLVVLIALWPPVALALRVIRFCQFVLGIK